jgi:hypothetical protein
VVIGAILGAEGRHTVLRLGLRDRWRQRFASYLNVSRRLPFQLCAVDRLPKNSSAQATETAPPTPPKAFTFGA